MSQENFTTKMNEKAEMNFKNIKESIKGLFDVLNLGVEDDLYFEAGKENITGLYQNLIELLLNEYGLRKIIKKIKNSEIDIDITLDDYLVQKLEKDL